MALDKQVCELNESGPGVCVLEGPGCSSGSRVQTKVVSQALELSLQEMSGYCTETFFSTFRNKNLFKKQTTIPII